MQRLRPAPVHAAPGGYGGWAMRAGKAQCETASRSRRWAPRPTSTAMNPEDHSNVSLPRVHCFGAAGIRPESGWRTLECRVGSAETMLGRPRQPLFPLSKVRWRGPAAGGICPIPFIPRITKECRAARILYIADFWHCRRMRKVVSGVQPGRTGDTIRCLAHYRKRSIRSASRSSRSSSSSSIPLARLRLSASADWVRAAWRKDPSP